MTRADAKEARNIRVEQPRNVLQRPELAPVCVTREHESHAHLGQARILYRLVIPRNGEHSVPSSQHCEDRFDRCQLRGLLVDEISTRR